MSNAATSLIANLLDRRFLRFLLNGLLNTGFGYGLFWLGLALGLGAQPSLLVATVLGVMFNFITTGRFVFGSSESSRLPRFIAVYIVMYAVNALALKLLTSAGLHPLPAQAIILPFNVILTYGGMRRFVFGGHRP